MSESVDAPNQTWPQWASASTPRDLGKRKTHFIRFAEWMNKNAPTLWGGSSADELTQEQTEELLTNLLSNESDLETHQIFANWWDILLAEGHRLKRWVFRPGSQRVKLPPERPAFVRHDFQLLNCLRELEAAWQNRICGTLRPDQIYNAFLLSAILNGGILSFGRLAGLLALREETIQVTQGLLWATLDPPEGSSSSCRSLRWFPDALTSALLTRAIEGHLLPMPPARAINTKEAQRRMLAACDSLELPTWRYRPDDLLRAARVSTALNVPGFVAAYLADEIESHSLPEAVFRRVCGWEQAGDVATSSAAERSAPEERGPLRLEASFDPDLPRDSQMSVARKVCKVLGNKRGAIERLKEILEENRKRLWPITHALISWTIWRLEPGSRLGVIKASSAETYFRTLAVHLIYEAEDLELLDLDVDDFETLYELAGKRIQTENRRPYFWARLRDFHDFLFLCGAPDIDLRELDGWTSSGQVRVSANLVTEREFGRFKTALTTEENQDVAKMVFLAGVLAYRTGLRRREVQMLRIQDIHPGPEPFLLIRPSRLATLKSNSSKRRIPLRPLLCADELDALMDFHERRKAQVEGEAGLLFADPGALWTPLPYARLMDPVTALFAAITGQIGTPFRFHHLRHSFANWILLALLAMDEPALLARKLPCIDSSLLEPERIKLLQDTFFPRSFDTPQTYPDRRHVFQVAALMGHLSPSTTFQSYLHLIDWLSGRYLDVALDARFRQFGATELGAICGLSGSMPYKGKYRALTGKPVDFMRHFADSRGGKYNATPSSIEPSHVHLPTLSELIRSPLPGPALLVTLLFRYFSGASAENLERIFAVPTGAIKAAAQAYQRMYAKQSIRTAKRHFDLPQPPRTKQDQQEYFRIVKATAEAYRNEKNRPALNAAAEALIQRTGPRTGQVYFGTKGRDPNLIMRGLLYMGISPEEMTIVVRRPDRNADDPENVQLALKTAKALGVKHADEVLKWESRTVKNVLLRLDILDTRHDQRGEPNHWEGRVRGINYAAMWLQFIEKT